MAGKSIAHRGARLAVLLVSIACAAAWAAGDAGRERQPAPDRRDAGEAAGAAGFQPDPQLLSAMEAFRPLLACPEFLERIRQLNRLGGPDHRRLVQHIVYLMATQSGVGTHYQVGGLLRSPWLNIDPVEVISAASPFLESEDPKFARATASVLRIEIPHESVELFDSAVGPLIRESMFSGQPLPEGLTRFLFRNYPAAALLTFARCAPEAQSPGAKDRDATRRAYEESRKILWAEHVIADTIWKHDHWFLERDRIEPQAAKELEKLARFKQWWVRLYVAEIV